MNIREVNLGKQDAACMKQNDVLCKQYHESYCIVYIFCVKIFGKLHFRSTPVYPQYSAPFKQLYKSYITMIHVVI